MTATSTLTPDQKRRFDAAATALAEKHGPGTRDLAYRIGQLEWHLGGLLALVADLAGPAAGQ